MTLNERLTIVDVGARSGLDERWTPYFAMIDAIGFEPDEEECRRLNETRFPYSVRFHPYALGARDGDNATLYICRSPVNSSVLEPNTELCRDYPYGDAMEVVGTRPVILQRMDSVCGDVRPDVIKIDTQGSELEVLIGAGRLLDSALAVDLEVEFVPQYRGQALFADVDTFMRERGFMLRGIRRTYWRERAEHLHADGGQIIHGDALYLRRELLDSPKGHVILQVYRQFDLLARLGATHLIPKRPWYTSAMSALLSRYSHRELRRLVDRLRPASATDWHDQDLF